MEPRLHNRAGTALLQPGSGRSEVFSCEDNGNLEIENGKL